MLGDAAEAYLEVSATGEMGAFGEIENGRFRRMGPGKQPRRRTAAVAAVTGIRDLGDQDYLFKDQREHLCAGVNEVREYYHTVD